MTDTLFEVVFQGRLVDGFSAADVKANVARLFKASPQQVEQMFTGKRVVIRNQLDQETALKYQGLLRKNGAISVVEAMKPADSPITTAPATTAPSPARPPVPPASSSVSAAPGTVPPRPVPPAAASPAAASSKPNPFLNTPATASAPASESGRLKVAGKRVDNILSGLNLQLDPVGVTLSEDQGDAAAPAPNVSHLSLAPAGVALSESRELPPPIVPDVDHLSIAPPGARLSDPKPDE